MIEAQYKDTDLTIREEVEVWCRIFRILSRLFFFLTVCNDIAEGLVVEVATNINWGEFHQSINFFLIEAGGFAGKGIQKNFVWDLALSRWVEDFEG